MIIIILTVLFYVVTRNITQEHIAQGNNPEAMTIYWLSKYEGSSIIDSIKII